MFFRNQSGKNGRPTKSCASCRKVNELPGPIFAEPEQKQPRKQFKQYIPAQSIRIK